MTESLQINIWGRMFTLPVIYDCYEGESVTSVQIDALEGFFSHLDWIEKSKNQVEEYCKERVADDDENQKKDNIFSYIKPETVFVKREEHYPRVALMCRYRYDAEHGLAVVFSQDGRIDVGTQDIIL